jgi:hypothetical protein
VGSALDQGPRGEAGGGTGFQGVEFLNQGKNALRDQAVTELGFRGSRQNGASDSERRFCIGGDLTEPEWGAAELS